MRGLKVALVLIGVLCLVSTVPATVLPWSSVVRYMEVFGVEAPPDHPVVVYCMRVYSLGFALIGIFFLVLASDPVRYRPMLVLAACGCWLVAVAALVNGWLTEMQPVWYLADVGASAVAGTLILAFWPRGVELGTAG